MSKLISLSAFMIATSIAAGAFAAHSLKGRLEPYYLEVFEKAAFYHLTQSLGLLLIAILANTSTASLSKIYFTLFIGIIIFSGSLYTLAITQIKWLGAITPIGGTAMIIAWLWLAVRYWRA